MANTEACLCCGSDLHTTGTCPNYDRDDRETMLLGATIFVNRFMENSSYGQNLLGDFEQALVLDAGDEDEEDE